MVITYDKNAELNCQKKNILILSDNFDKKVCMDIWITSTKNSKRLSLQYLHNYQYFVEQLPSNA